MGNAQCCAGQKEKQQPNWSVNPMTEVVRCGSCVLFIYNLSLHGRYLACFASASQRRWEISGKYHNSSDRIIDPGHQHSYVHYLPLSNLLYSDSFTCPRSPMRCNSLTRNYPTREVGHPQQPHRVISASFATACPDG